jgi:hypothetical protein
MGTGHYYFDEIEELFSFKVRWPVSGSWLHNQLSAELFLLQMVLKMPGV